ncbi:hypothetical protein BDM02DRAFT_3115784 [Thelephora ganbajun]|uniref:Uncharacterized protein n=1 Tax=Thelephora ganbajun TaxID=370292 RepID=A0ACB6ZFJ6_THEGA|nr:hypothetical protein BDM02DRAFT_3115784 [Thelephora ganbajun]
MTTNPTSNSSPIFRDGRLRPGIYKIRNIFTETYVDIEVHSRRVVCRPAKDLEEGRGLWEIKQLGAGYMVQRAEPGEPEQFCTLMDQIKDVKDGSPLSVAAYPVAWRVEIVDDDKHRGFEYVRLCWGATRWSWAVSHWSKDNGAQVVSWTEGDHVSVPLLMWKLIPVKVEGMTTPSRSSSETLGPGSLPSYDEDASGQSLTRAQRTESERDDFGTIVTEVTTITTRKRYRVEGA